MLHEHLHVSAPEVLADAAEASESRNDALPDNLWTVVSALGVATAHRLGGVDRARHLQGHRQVH